MIYYFSPNSNERLHIPPASLYKYEVEQFDADDRDISQVMIVDDNQIRRKKGGYSRERSKLFLKQYVEVNSKGVWCIKDSVLDDFGVNRVKFDQIFDGPVPDFDPSRKLLKAVNGKKVKQETLAKFLTKHGSDNNKISKVQKSNLLEEMKKKEEEYKQRKELLKQQRAEERLAEKLKRKEENIKVSSYLREWYKPKEDLELEDQKVISCLLYMHSLLNSILIFRYCLNLLQ